MASATEVLNDLSEIIQTVRSDGVVTVDMLLKASTSMAQTGITVDTMEESALGPEITPAEAIEDIAFGIPALFLLLVAIALFLVLVVLTLVTNWAGKIPVAGSFVGNQIDDLAALVAGAIHDLIHEIEAVVTDTVRAVKRLLRWLVGLLGFDTVENRRAAVHSVWAPLSRDTAILRETIATTVVPALDSTAKDLMNLHEQLHGVNATLYHGPRSLTGQMRGVQHDLKYINDELGRVWHDLSKQAHEIATLQSAGPHAPPSLKSLQQEVERLTHDVQAIPPELATIRQRLTELENRPAGHGGMTELQVHHLNYAHYIAAALAPLLALAPFTVDHLKNLRKLQDDPCQCPTIGGVPNPLIAAIVADLVITEGL